MAEIDTATKPEIETIPTEPVKNIDNSSPMNVCDKKEEEQPTTTTTHTCVTVPQQEEEKPDNPAQEEPAPTEQPQASSTTTTFKPEPTTQTESELLAAGKKLLSEEKYEEAVPLLSDALQIIQTKNMATGIESAKYYMAYGEALLRFVQSSNDLFAAPVRESQQQHIEEQQEEEDEEDAPPLVTDATEQTEAAKESEAPKEAEINGKEEQDEDEDDDLNQQQQEEPAPEEAKPAGGDVDTSEDREIAWETFEYARTIIEEFLSKPENSTNDSYLKMLALCHSFLGELLIEDENNESALLEFEKALEVQNKCKDGFIKCRQRAFNHFMACLAAQFCEKDDDALKHCNVALQGLSERICQILKHYQCTEEFKENNDYEQIVKVGDEFMMKLTEEQKKEEQGKELKELIGVMGDLCAKLEEVEETIKLRKEQAVNGDGNHNDGGNEVDLANMDPFQALIMGLTDKFVSSMDQEELAKMKEMDEEVDVDENKNTSNGVTTIGFGDVKPVDDNEEINDLGSFGVKRKEKKEDVKKVVVVEDKEVEDVKEKVKEVVVSGEADKKEKKIGKKRSMEDADIDGDDCMMNGNAKKMKLNSGDAAAVENGDGN